MKKAIIKAANVCNNNCLFCHFKENHDHIELSFQKIYRKILQIKPKADMILLSGGEITIDKNFLKIIDFIYNQELAIGLITNARMLSNQKLCNHLHKKGLKYVYTSLHGPDKELHNKLTQSESFEQTLLGIRNILRFSDIECIVNIVVNKMNMLRLREIIDLAVGKNIPIITIDGPSGAGKGSVSKLLAKKLGWCFLDSGAIYRLLAIAVIRKKIPSSK